MEFGAATFGATFAAISLKRVLVVPVIAGIVIPDHRIAEPLSTRQVRALKGAPV